jgi:quercetin dioxygenase-like cupin family protein
MGSVSTVIGTFGELEVEHPFEGITRRTLQASRATIAIYDFEPGSEFPLHTHPQEQITIVEQGDIEFVSPDGSVRLDEGGWSVVAPDVEHQVVAGDRGARILAIVVPPRAPDGYSIAAAPDAA